VLAATSRDRCVRLRARRRIRFFACDVSLNLREREWLLVNGLVLTLAADANSANSISNPATMARYLKLLFWPTFLSPSLNLHQLTMHGVYQWS
jgi:hypothetical protein